MVVAALVVSLIALAISGWALRYASVSARAARDSADVAQRTERRSLETELQVRWEVEPGPQSRHLLRNAGPGDAGDVQIETDRNNILRDAGPWPLVRAHETRGFIWSRSWMSAASAEITVIWTAAGGERKQATLAMPRG